MHPAGQHRVGVLPQEAADAAQLLHGPGDLPAGRRAVRGAEGQVVPVLPGELLRLADPLPQRERGVVVPVRLGRGGQPLGLLRGPDRRGERARDVVAGQAVMGQLRRGPRHGGEPARVGQQLGEPGVQPGPLPGQQVGVEGLPDQGVPEHVPVRAARHEQLLGHAIADRVLVLRTVQPGRGPDDVVVHPAPADRRRPQHLLGRGGQLLDPGQQQGGQPAGQHVAAGCSPHRATSARAASRRAVAQPADRAAGTARRHGGQQFLRVVGIALRPGHHPVQGGRVQRRARQRGQVIGHVRVAQRPQLDRGHAGQPQQLRDHRAERVPAVQVIGAVRGHHGHPLPVQDPAQERDQVAGGAVGPVQVLEDQQHRVPVGQLGEQPEHRAEQLLLGESGDFPARLRHHVPVRQQAAQNRPGGQCGRERFRCGAWSGRALPQRVGQRQVRNAVAQFRATPGQDQEPAVRGPGGELGDQPGLPHTRVAADQRVGRTAFAGVVEQAEQARQFTVPADQPSARRPQHPPSIPASAGCIAD